MTEKNVKIPVGVGALSPFHIEMNRTKRGISMMASGVVGINDFGEDRAVLMTHGGRIIISGGRLSVVIYEHNTVEISGKIAEVKFTYGKN